jgi:hypothetical protein
MPNTLEPHSVKLTGGEGQFSVEDVLTVRVKPDERVIGELSASATFNVKTNVPVAVGVPETVPRAASRLRPAGKDPATTLHA